jgi:YidC/Oxa1 family membrane protein insertase
VEKRFILFILICLVAFPLYYRLVLPKPEQKATPSPAPASSIPAAPSTAGDPRPPAPAPAVAADPALPDFPAVGVILENDVLRLDVRSEGAGIHAAHLLAYRDEG